MQTVKIPLSGITRNTDDGVSVDGSCMELINARSKNGSIEPVGQPIKIAQLDKQFKNIYRHEKADRYLGVTTEEELYEISTDFKSVKTLSVSGVKGVEFIGFTVSLLTQDGIKYMLFKHEAYYYLGELPELPEIKIGKEVKIQEVSGTASYHAGLLYNGIIDSEQHKLWRDTAYGYFLKAISELNRTGFFAHSTGIRVAFRLYDGSYVKHSPVRLIKYNGEAEWKEPQSPYQYVRLSFSDESSLTPDWYKYERKVACQNTQTWDEQTFKFYHVGIKPTFTFEDLNLEAWKDLIISIDIFASKGHRRNFDICPISWEGILHPASEHTPDTDPDFETKSTAKSFVGESMFYKIASISLDGVLDYTEDSVSADNLALNDRLIDDTNTHQTLISHKSHVYNNRLHLFGTVQHHFSGYDFDYLSDYNSANTGETGTVEVHTYINTNQGESVVLKRKSMLLPTILPPYLMYPDSRAHKMIIKLIKQNGAVKCKEFLLKPHKTMNLSYAIYTKGFTRNIAGTAVSLVETNEPQPDKTEYWQTTDIPVYGSPVAEIDNAKLMVSALNNPFYFPPETTYQFQSEIIALQSNTTALSQGQFGQHPLYVFCKNGVEAMTVGNGTVAYATATPVTRDAAVSSNVCGMDSFVCFLSARGVMLIQGTQTRCISEGIDGFLPSCLGTSIMNKILSIPDMYKNASIVPFYEFIQNASIGYNYLESEIIVANKLYHYSYVYNMNSAQWHKINTSISTFINTYPETYAMLHKEGTTIIQDLNNKNLSVAKIAILTRPIKLGTTTHKRILQTALRGIVKKSLSDLYLREQQVVFRGEPLMIFNDVAFYILGSNDTENYALIGGKEKISELRDLVTKMNKSKAYKYFMICLIGGVRSDVSINYVEMVVDETFANRLR